MAATITHSAISLTDALQVTVGQHFLVTNRIRGMFEVGIIIAVHSFAGGLEVETLGGAYPA
jgi:hypothetical protein